MITSVKDAEDSVGETVSPHLVRPFPTAEDLEYQLAKDAYTVVASINHSLTSIRNVGYLMQNADIAARLRSTGTDPGEMKEDLLSMADDLQTLRDRLMTLLYGENTPNI